MSNLAKKNKKETGSNVIPIVQIKNMRTLLSKNVNVNAKDKDGKTALMWAAMDGKKSRVKSLLNKGASIDEKDKTGKTALMWAALEGNTKLIIY